MKIFPSILIWCIVILSKNLSSFHFVSCSKSFYTMSFRENRNRNSGYIIYRYLLYYWIEMAFWSEDIWLGKFFKLAVLAPLKPLDVIFEPAPWNFHSLFFSSRFHCLKVDEKPSQRTSFYEKTNSLTSYSIQNQRTKQTNRLVGCFCCRWISQIVLHISYDSDIARTNEVHILTLSHCRARNLLVQMIYFPTPTRRESLLSLLWGKHLLCSVEKEILTITIFRAVSTNNYKPLSVVPNGEVRHKMSLLFMFLNCVSVVQSIDIFRWMMFLS